MLLGANNPERVVVVRALRGLGDFLCSIPALRALRSALPQAKISLLGLRSAGPLLQRFPYLLDDLIEFPGFPGIPEVPFEPSRTSEFLSRVQGKFDLALQMHGSGTNSNAFTAMLGAGRTAGLYQPALWCPDPRTFFPYPSHRHEIRRWTYLIESLGFDLQGEQIDFPVTEADRRRLREVWPQFGRKRYVCLHPGAFEEERRWPAERFAAVGNELAEQGYRVVLTGTGAEQELTAAVGQAMKRESLDLGGRTDLAALAALLEGADLVVCNDTGVSHLTAAVNTPSVVIFRASDPERWAPLNQSLHKVAGEVLPERANACRHCAAIKDHRCLGDACKSLLLETLADPGQASVDEVLEKAGSLLRAKAPI